MAETPSFVYMPILKGKEGEFAALEALSGDVRNVLLPLVEVPRVPYDYINERAAKSLDAHLNSVAQRLAKCWGNGQPIYLDVPWLGEDEQITNAAHAMQRVLANCAGLALRVVPVVRVGSHVDYIESAAHHAAECRTGVAIRLTVDNFAEEVDTARELEQLQSHLGDAQASEIDLLIDLEDVGRDGRDLLVVRYVLTAVPNVMSWRRVVIAGASFPEDLSEIDAASTTKLPRREWQLWQALWRRPDRLPRHDLIYGDYGIAHPIPKELDPRTMRMSASVRYTTEEDWLIVKGRNVRQYGFEQYHDLSRLLVSHADFCGPNFSWGDQFIADCARGKQGPGNATTWRKVGTNHHLTFVTRQLAKSRVVV